MRLLGIDTSTQAATAAVVDSGEIICEYTLNQKKTHSVHLVPMIEEMLASAELTLSDMDGFACGVGPGSFTGVRIGVATVKGFAQALSKPVVCVDSLKTLAAGVGPTDKRIVSAMFARVDEVFCAVYRREGNALITELAPTVLTIDELLSFCGDKPCIFVGDAGAVHQEKIKEVLGAAVSFADVRQNMVSAANLTLLAEKEATENGFLPYDEISPLYLRPSQAEREYEEKNKGEKE